MGTSLPDTLNQYDPRIKLGLHLDEALEEVGWVVGGCGVGGRVWCGVVGGWEECVAGAAWGRSAAHHGAPWHP